MGTRAIHGSMYGTHHEVGGVGEDFGEALEDVEGLLALVLLQEEVRLEEVVHPQRRQPASTKAQEPHPRQEPTRMHVLYPSFRGTHLSATSAGKGSEPSWGAEGPVMCSTQTSARSSQADQLSG